jgi:hypothetical protein
MDGDVNCTLYSKEQQPKMDEFTKTHLACKKNLLKFVFCFNNDVRQPLKELKA